MTIRNEGVPVRCLIRINLAGADLPYTDRAPD